MAPRTSCVSRTPIATTRSRRRSGTRPIRVSRHSISRAIPASARGCSGAGCARRSSPPGYASGEGPLLLSEGDYRDSQGLVRVGHGHLSEARFYLMQIADPALVREWIRRNIENVTTAVPDRHSIHALHLAFTCEGLRKLGLPDAVLEDFSLEFTGGMVDPNRSRRLGDVEANDPECWQWGVPGKSYPDLVVLVYGEKDKAKFDARAAEVKGDLWDKAFRHVYSLSTIRHNDLEPFGFVDGVSQPTVDWARRKPVRLQDTTAYTNLSALGEFLLGYPNEYGRYTDRPLLD